MHTAKICLSPFKAVLVVALTLLCSVAMGQSSQTASAKGNTQSYLLSERFNAQHVVDARMVPRAWLGCCHGHTLCSGSKARQIPECHRLSDRLSSQELHSELGANVALTAVAINPEARPRITLSDALTHSNQLGDKPDGKRINFLYVVDLKFAELANFSAIAKWSKHQHLAGVRGIRFNSSQSVVREPLDVDQVQKSLRLLFGRYFLVDVGQLSPTELEMVLKHTSPRQIPLLASGLELGASHRCSSTTQRRSLSPSLMCEIVKSGGVLAIGPTRTLFEAGIKRCERTEDVNDHLVVQFNRFMKLSCQRDGDAVDMSRHLAMSSVLPMLDRLERQSGSEIMLSRWGLFARTLRQQSVSQSAVAQLMGINMVELIRRTLPGVQPAELLFPVGNQSFTSDKGIQFQWSPPKTNDPKRMAGQVFGMRRGRLVIERRVGTVYQPWQTAKVVSGDRKSIMLKEGNFRWRLVSANRQSSATSRWGYFSVTDAATVNN
jgi:hypothetical protein